MQLIWVASINIAFKVTPFRLLKKKNRDSFAYYGKELFVEKIKRGVVSVKL